MNAQKTVVIVDDEDVVRHVTEAMLKRLGYDVVGCRDGETAVLHLRDTGIAVDGVVLDLTMPNMTGAAAFEEIRRLRGGVPVVLTSGYGEQAASEILMREPKVAFVAKPYTLDELGVAVAKVMA